MANKRVLVNGKIFTANDQQPWAEAVVIEGNKIAFVGSTEEAKAKAGDIALEDLGGKLVTPGLIDGHLHVYAAIVFDGLLRLDALSPEEMLVKIREDVEAHPDRNAYTGMGWFDFAFGEAGPNKADLDAICPDKPMAYLSASMHTVWCNSKALEAAGVFKDTPDIDPASGVVYTRDENGEPTGWAKEIASMDKVMGAAKYFDDNMIEAATERFMQMCSSNGITTLVDCGAISFLKYLINDDLCAELERDEAPLRLNFCGFAGVAGLYEMAFNDSVAYSKKYNGDRFFCNFYKLFNDGTLESFSAAIRNPYEDGTIIKPIMTVETLAQKFEECANAGINVNIHAIGAEAIHNVLEAAGVVRAKGITDLRITCSHCSYVYPEDMELFGKYDVFADTTGLWCSDPKDEATFELVKKLTEATPYAMKTIKDGGARMGFGSDFPTDPTSFPPMQNIECLITRRALGDPNALVHNPEEALTVEEVLRGYTIENAYQLQREDVLGSIEVGKYADLTVFDQDLFEIDPYSIHDVKIAETIKDGLTTYKL